MNDINAAVQPFIDAGFKKFPKNDVIAKYAEFGLQKRFRDDKGIKYFVTVFVYDFSKIPNYPNPNEISFSLDSQFESRLTGDIVHVTTNVTSPENAVDIVDKLWNALEAEYYETNY